jgi:NAD(P)-dependent dehydrogenase (short-subunit alcohol dehydrogenase family)
MKVLLIGANGTIGQAVAAELGQTHDIIRASRNGADFQVDIGEEQSVARMFAAVGSIDAIVATVGSVHFGPFLEMTTQQFATGLQHKLLGQVRLTLLGHAHLNDGGSVTLTTGVLAREPIRDASNATTVNTALEGFVRAAAIELPRGLRINAVSATVVTESWDLYSNYFAGFEPVPARRVALAYRRSVDGAQTGQIYVV